MIYELAGICHAGMSNLTVHPSTGQRARSAPALTLAVPACAREVAGIRRAIGLLGRQAGLDPDRLADVSLAVGEACANAVVHAYGDGEPGVLRATAEITPDGLEVVIADEGRGLAPRPDSPGAGLGLPLMAQLATAIEIRPGSDSGTEIWMRFGPGHQAASFASWAQTG